MDKEAIKGAKRNLTGLWELHNKIIPVPKSLFVWLVLYHQQNHLNLRETLKTLDFTMPNKQMK